MISPPENYRLLIEGEVIEENDIIYHKNKGKWIDSEDYEGRRRIGSKFNSELNWPRARKIKQIEITEAQKLSVLKFLKTNKARNGDCAIEIKRNREIYKELAKKNFIGAINFGYGDRYFLLDNLAEKH